MRLQPEVGTRYELRDGRPVSELEALAVPLDHGVARQPFGETLIQRRRGPVAPDRHPVGPGGGYGHPLCSFAAMRATVIRRSPAESVTVVTSE